MKAAGRSELGQAREAMVNVKTQGNWVSQWNYGGRTEDGVRVHAALAECDSAQCLSCGAGSPVCAVAR